MRYNINCKNFYHWLHCMCNELGVFHFLVTFLTNSEMMFVHVFCVTVSELSGASPVLAGQTVKGSEFQERYLDKLFEDPQVIGVFLQDRVSSWMNIIMDSMLMYVSSLNLMKHVHMSRV